MMTKTVRNTFHTIGDRGGDVAKAIGTGTADIAMRFGRGTASLAHRIGPRRGLIGLALVVAAVGGSVLLVRYLRARSEEQDAIDEAGSGANRKSRKRSHGSSLDARA